MGVKMNNNAQLCNTAFGKKIIGASRFAYVFLFYVLLFDF